MTRMILPWLFFCILAPQDPKAEAVKAEVARHQGTWQAVTSIYQGKSAPESLTRSIVRVVDGDHVVWKRDGKSFAGTTVELDPGPNPHTIDVIPDGGRLRDQRVLGIYKLEGDTLTICMAGPKKPRPETFEAAEGSGRTLMTFARVKPTAQ